MRTLVLEGADDEQAVGLRRDAAREKAATIRVQHRKQERRRRWFVGGGIAVVLLAIIAVVTFSIVSTIRPPSAGPMNMLSDGIQIGNGLAAKQTSPLQPGDEPIASTPDAGSTTVALRLYVDYLCADCGAFERANSEQLRSWVSSGAVSFEVHPLALLDARSQGSNYSTRAANAAACVANFDADRFFDFNDALLADQPAESTTGLSDDELIERAEGAGVTETDAVSDCIRDERFRTWVGEATDRAVAGPLPDTEVASVAETPTILVNGLPFAGPFDDATAFSQFLVQAAGASFAETSTETQAPAATDSPTPAPSTSATATPTPTATSSN